MVFLVVLVVLAGLIGGAINALLSDNGFLMPRPQSVGGGTIYRPGFLGNMLIGAVSSFVSWALYGPLANVVIAGPAAALNEGGAVVPGITLSSLGGAVLVGVAGSRWLTNEVDKAMLRDASVIAARSQAQNPDEQEQSTQIANSMSLSSSPAHLLRLVQNLPNVGTGQNS